MNNGLNEKKILIVIDKKDKTDNIDNYKFIKIENKIKCQIKYKGSNNLYNYNPESVKIFTDPEILKKDIYINDKKEENISIILKFENYIKVIYNFGKTRLFDKDKITLKTSTDTLSYLKEIAAHTSGKTIEGEKSFLAKQYSKINYIDSDCVLSYYIDKKDLKKFDTNFDNIIYPFGFNASQKKL